MHLISFSLIISSNTSSLSLHFFFQTVSNRCIQDTDQSSFISITGLFYWNREKLQHKSAFNKPLFGKENEISSRFLQCHTTKRLQHHPTLPESHQIQLLPARTWPRAISRLWLPAPAPSCAELLLSLCSLWARAKPPSSMHLENLSPGTSLSPSKSTARNRKWGKKNPRETKSTNKKIQPNNNKSHWTPGFQNTYKEWQQIVTVVTFLPKYSEIHTTTDSIFLEVYIHNPHNIY